MAFLGMRGTGDWVENERPENWREGILRLYPNGSMILTGMSGMFGSEPTDDPHYHWWTKQLPLQAGDVAGVFTDAALTAAYAGGGVSGDIVYAQVAADLASEFRGGMTINLTKNLDLRYNTFGRVESVVQNGANSYIAVTLLKDASATYDLDEADWIEVAGSSHPEGDTMPEAISYDPVQRTNVTQIFRTPLSITRTARKTRLRTEEAYARMKKEALELHGISVEKAFIKGFMSVTTGDNGKPQRTTRGHIEAIREYAPENMMDFRFDDDYSGDLWTASGSDWLDTQLERIFRYGADEKLAVCGSGALDAINKLAKAGSVYNISAREASYGIKVVEWITPHGTLFFKTHPLLTQNPSDRHTALILEPGMHRTRTIDDLKYKSDDSENKNTNNSKDATDEEYLSEIGLEHHHEITGGVLTGMGLDNAMA